MKPPRKSKSIVLILAAVLTTSVSFARITVKFGIDSITVNQRAGAIQIPVLISGDPTPNGQYTSSMSYRTQDGTAVFETHYFYNVGIFGNYVDFEPGDSRTKYLTFSINFTESILDRTFTVLLDPTDTFPFNNTYDADADDPSFVNVTILGVSPQYLALKSKYNRFEKKLKKTRKISDRKKRKKKSKRLKKKLVKIAVKLNRTV